MLKQDKFEEGTFRRAACWSKTNLKMEHVEERHVEAVHIWRAGS